MKKLSHYDEAGRARMVDVSEKAATKRTATAQAFVRIRTSVLKKLPQNPKGNPLEVARIAGIAAAKRTPDLIPMCHPLLLAILPTGDEIVEAGDTPQDYQIRNSNAWSLAVQVRRAGGIPEILPIARDNPKSTHA